ncbi:hypothetical protein KI387_004348, partial [Taxus chinensis]
AEPMPRTKSVRSGENARTHRSARYHEMVARALQQNRRKTRLNELPLHFPRNAMKDLAVTISINLPAHINGWWVSIQCMAVARTTTGAANGVAEPMPRMKSIRSGENARTHRSTRHHEMVARALPQNRRKTRPNDLPLHFPRNAVQDLAVTISINLPAHINGWWPSCCCPDVVPKFSKIMAVSETLSRRPVVPSSWSLRHARRFQNGACIRLNSRTLVAKGAHTCIEACIRFLTHTDASLYFGPYGHGTLLHPPKPHVVVKPPPKPPIVVKPHVVVKPPPKPPVVVKPTPKPPVVVTLPPKPLVVVKPPPKPPVIVKPPHIYTKPPPKPIPPPHYPYKSPPRPKPTPTSTYHPKKHVLPPHHENPP